MTISIDTLFTVCKVLLSVSLFYVWVVRYENIKKEFVEYKLPTWLRDLVGILKLSFSLMIISNDNNLVWIGSMGIIVLMIGALATHFKVKNPVVKFLPSLIFLLMSLYISAYNCGYIS